MKLKKCPKCNSKDVERLFIIIGYPKNKCNNCNKVYNTITETIANRRGHKRR